jgi:hypothetical protein
MALVTLSIIRFAPPFNRVRAYSPEKSRKQLLLTFNAVFRLRHKRSASLATLWDWVASFSHSRPSQYLIPYIAAAGSFRSATRGEEPNWPEEELPSAHAMPTDGILSSCFGVATWNSQSPPSIKCSN